MTHVGRSSIPVVGYAVDHDSDPARAIALISNGVVGGCVFAASGATDGTFDGVFGHADGMGPVHREAQAAIGALIRSTDARCHGDLADEFVENLAPPVVLCALSVLDV